MTQEKQTEINLLIKIVEEKRRNFQTVAGMIIPAGIGNAVRLFDLYAQAQADVKQAERALSKAQEL